MRRAGKVSPLLLGVVVALAALGGILALGQKSPAETGSRFMDALARGDAETLTKLSFAPGKSDAQLLDAWRFTTGVAGKHYLFAWKIIGSNVVDEDSANVRLAVQRNLGGSSYDENYGLPMQKVKGEWKVDASGINREMYPGLPRSGKE